MRRVAFIKIEVMPFLLAFLILLYSFPVAAETISESPQQVWKVSDRRWSVEEERQFGKWVEENITEDFFIRHKIPVDCADVPYAIRWIYEIGRASCRERV